MRGVECGTRWDSVLYKDRDRKTEVFHVWVTPRQKPGAQHSVLLSPVGVRAPALEDSFAASQDVRLQAVG